MVGLTGSGRFGVTKALCFCRSRHTHLIPWLFLPAGPLLEAVTDDVIREHFFDTDTCFIGTITASERVPSIYDTMSLFGPSVLPLLTTSLVPDGRCYLSTDLFEPPPSFEIEHPFLCRLRSTFEATVVISDRLRFRFCKPPGLW